MRFIMPHIKLNAAALIKHLRLLWARLFLLFLFVKVPFNGMPLFCGLFRVVLVLVIAVYRAAPVDFNAIKCNSEGAFVVTCFVESRLIVSTPNNEILTLSSGSGVLISGGNLSVDVKSTWPTYSVAGGPGSPYSNVFHSQSTSFTCITNCCPSNGMFTNNLLNANSTVTYVCGTVAEVVSPKSWTVVTTIIGAINTTAIGSMLPLSSPTIDIYSMWCVPTQQDLLQSELQYLTPPFLVPTKFFGSSVHRIGMTQVSFAEAFNCSQERGYLTSVTQEITLFDQFAPFRIANLLTNSFNSNTTTATYINSTYNGTSGRLQTTVRVIGPLYVVLDRSIGVPKPLVLLAALLALTHASNIGSSTIVQLAPSFRAPTPPSSLTVVTTCTNIGEDTSSMCHSIALDDAIGVNNKIVAVCVQEKPVPLNTSWRVVANKSIRQVTPQAPLIVSVPLNGTAASQRCRVDVMSSTGLSYMTILIKQNGTSSFILSEAQSQVQWSLAPQKVFSGPVVQLCVLGLDEVFNTSVCVPMSNEDCAERYGGARVRYDTSLERCVPSTALSLLSVAQHVFLSLSDTNTTPTPTTASPTPSPPVAAFPWMTAAWRLSINTSSLCGLHGVWNESTWWCDCTAGWGTDYSQDPWSGANYTWCGTPLQWLTASPGAWDDSSSHTVLSFITAWVDNIGDGDAKTIVVTLVGLLVILSLLALVIQGVWVCMGPAPSPPGPPRTRRTKHRRRKRRVRLIEGAYDAPLQIMWHPREPYEHAASPSTSSSNASSHTSATIHVATREEIELGSVFSSSTATEDSTESTATTFTINSSSSVEVPQHRSVQRRSKRRNG